MKILHLDENKKWVAVEKGIYDNEAHLQNLLADDINILPFDEIGYETPFITIGKEIGLANGSLDLLAVSPQGHIALIETKLDKNPEVKRTVVGQIIGYGSYLWNKSYEDLEITFKKFLTQQKINFEGNLFEYISSKIPDVSTSEEEFKEGIEKRLRLGSFSLLIVVDKANQELIDIANYLNDRTNQEIDFYVIEMELIGDGQEQFLIPRLVNPPRKNTAYGQTKGSDNYDRTPITKGEFLGKLSKKGSELANKLLSEFETDEKVKVTWRKNGFSLITDIPESLIVNNPGYNPDFSYLYFYSTGPDSEELQFGYPEGNYTRFSELKSLVGDYVNFYRSLKGFNEKKNIKDLSVFDDQTTSKFIELIKDTAKNLSQKQEV